jgi:hypothetical protein
MLQTALALAARGLHVFPCCVADKIPATPHGCLDATVDQDTIRQWWRHQPKYNVAVATGEKSGIFVLDVDGENGEAALRNLETRYGALPSTVETITGGGGRHIWFRYPGHPVKNSAGTLGRGLDIRGDRGSIISPPSVHASGRAYQWSVDSGNSFAAAPQWLSNKIVIRDAYTPTTVWRDLVASGADEGCRDVTVTKLAGYVIRYLDPIVAHDLLQSWNLTHCRPPLPAADVRRICDSISKRELQKKNGR